MNNENGGELFPAPGPEAAPGTSAAELPASGADGAVRPEDSCPVITEDNIPGEKEIPDTDAGGARSCGEFLRMQREKLNLTREDVFEALKLKPEVIGALEEEDFSRLPEPVYVIAYVKRLCRFYNVNNALAREFLDDLRSRIDFDVPENVAQSVKGSDVSEENIRRIRNLALAAVLMLLLLIGSGVAVVVMNLRRSGTSAQPKFSENILVDLQPRPELRVTEL